jgi:hypothetical protein
MNTDSKPGPQLRSLAAELGIEVLPSAAGFHDFEHAYVLPPRAGYRLVASHEGIHDELLAATAFGACQRIFRRLHQRSNEAHVRAAAAQLLADLVRFSTLTHECTATYLSIKAFPLSETARLIEEHPEKYKTFYARYADVIDPFVTTTFVQYHLGKALGSAAMNIPWIGSLRDWRPDRIVEVPTEGRPDTRLLLLLNTVTSHLKGLLPILSSAVDSRRAQYDIPETFDVSLEVAWEELPEPVFTAVTECVRRETVRWLHGVTEHSCPTLDFHQVEVCAEEVVQAIETTTGTSLFDDNDRLRLSELAADQMGYKGSWARTLIDNSVAVSGLSLPLLPDDVKPQIVLHKPPGPRVFISRPFSRHSMEDLRWRRLVFTGEDSAYGDEISHATFKKALLARSLLAATGIPLSQQSVVVGPLDPMDEEWSFEIYREVLACHTLANDSHSLLIGVDSLVWYMGGNIYRWHDWLLASGPTKFVMFYPEGSYSADPLKAIEMARSGVGGITWWAFECEALHGLFLKIASAGAALPLSGLINADLTQDRISRMTSDEQSQAAGLIGPAARAIWTTWPTL